MSVVWCEGCTAGSTVVDEQLREIRDAAPNTSERCRPKQQQQQSTWATAARPRSDTDQTVFRVYKGIKCFDFCKSQNVVATGGTTVACLAILQLALLTSAEKAIMFSPVSVFLFACLSGN